MVMNEGKIVANSTPHDIHKEVSDSIIRCQTKVSRTHLQKLSEVASVCISGRFSEIRSTNPNKTVIELLTVDPNLNDLSISQPKLEDIFSELSSKKSTSTHRQVGEKK
jgi:ABC-type uncharacterized transport system ATPase subunit